MRREIILLGICVTMMAIYCPVADEVKDTTKVDQPKVIERKIKTIYDMNGRPVNQGQDRKGWHQVVGSISILRGRGIVTLNMSITEGKQDVSFLSSLTYRGVAWSLDTTSTNRYWIVPLTANKFMVKSSDSTDNGTIHWKVEGE